MFGGAIRIAISKGVRSSRALAKSSVGVKASSKLLLSATLAAPLLGLKDESDLAKENNYMSRIKVGQNI